MGIIVCCTFSIYYNYKHSYLLSSSCKRYFWLLLLLWLLYVLTQEAMMSPLKKTTLRLTPDFMEPNILCVPTGKKHMEIQTLPVITNKMCLVTGVLRETGRSYLLAARF